MWNHCGLKLELSTEETQTSFHFCKHQVSLNTDSRGTKSSKPASTTSSSLILFSVNRNPQAADSKYLEAVHYLQKFLFHSKERNGLC